MFERFGGSGSIRNDAYHHFDPKWVRAPRFATNASYAPAVTRGDNMRTSFSSPHKRDAKKRDGHSWPLAAPLALIGLPRT
jgi:hypothetical protein